MQKKRRRKSHAWAPLNVQLYLYVLDKVSWCTIGLCSAWMCPLPHPSYSLPPYPSHYRLSPIAALQRDGPGWSTPYILCLPSTNCCYLFRLIYHNNRIKVSVCMHHISLGGVAHSAICSPFKGVESLDFQPQICIYHELQREL